MFGRDRMGRNIGRHIEKHDFLAKREHDQQHRRSNEAQTAANNRKPFLFPGHCCPSGALRPNSLACARIALP